MLGPHMLPNSEWFETDVSRQPFWDMIHFQAEKHTHLHVYLLMSSKYITFYCSNSVPSQTYQVLASVASQKDPLLSERVGQTPR